MFAACLIPPPPPQKKEKKEKEKKEEGRSDSHPLLTVVCSFCVLPEVEDETRDSSVFIFSLMNATRTFLFSRMEMSKRKCVSRFAEHRRSCQYNCHNPCSCAQKLGESRRRMLRLYQTQRKECGAGWYHDRHPLCLCS